MDKPLRELGQVQKDLLYWGVYDARFTRHFPDISPPETSRKGRFEGVATAFLRRYAEHIENPNYIQKIEGSVVPMPLSEVLDWVRELEVNLSESARAVAGPIVDDLVDRVSRLGNTVLVIEHDPDMMLAADYIIDVGPGAGRDGGRVTAVGTPAEITEDPHSETGRCLRALRQPVGPAVRRKPKGQLVVKGAKEHNLKDITVSIPVGVLAAVTGVTGSGKSTLIFDILDSAASMKFNRSHTRPGKRDEIIGLHFFERLVTVNQTPIGRVPRSNAATYTDVFTPIRNLYASSAEAKAAGLTSRDFSFNVPGGRCERCEGAGVVTVNMHFLPDVQVLCPVCKGRRFKKTVLQVKYKGFSIADILDMTIQEAHELFADRREIAPRLKVLVDVGMGYLKLGQPATTLSGGEAQRVKLAKDLGRTGKGRTLYLLDEPTTGLYPADVDRLMLLLNGLVDAGNTVCVVEHNLDLVAKADWVIDLGPEGGRDGGRVIAEGTPEEIAANNASHTGCCLRTRLRL